MACFSSSPSRRRTCCPWPAGRRWCRRCLSLPLARRALLQLPHSRPRLLLCSSLHAALELTRRHLLSLPRLAASPPLLPLLPAQLPPGPPCIPRPCKPPLLQPQGARATSAWPSPGPEPWARARPPLLCRPPLLLWPAAPSRIPSWTCLLHSPRGARGRSRRPAPVLPAASANGVFPAAAGATLLLGAGADGASHGVDAAPHPSSAVVLRSRCRSVRLWQIRTSVVRWKRSTELFLPTRLGTLCRVRLVAMW
jgi:hypothetical protein